MKILVATAGPMPARNKARYVINIAKKLGADVTVLHIFHEEDRERGEEAVKFFTEVGREANVKVTGILKRGDIVSTIIEYAEKEPVNLIIMGASEGKVVDEWVSANVMEKANTPVVVIPHGLEKSMGSLD